MKNKTIIIIAILIALPIINGRANAQFRSQQQSLRSLFSDVKAFSVDDAIMVYIAEDTQADNTASSSESRSTDLNAGASLGTGSGSTNLDAGLGTGNQFKGSGSTSRKERIRSRISARVVEVKPNGNLSIEGKRTTKINGETQTITIKGIVRPVDVMSDNSVYSYSILDLTLIIEGEGNVSETQEPGLITKFLRLLF